MDGIKPQAMIEPDVPGGRMGGAAADGIWPSVKGWFQEQDPNFWSVLLGSIGQSAPPGTWQHQLGGTASQIARGQIMAKTMRTEREERKRRWDDLMRVIGGGGEEGVSPLAGRTSPLPGVTSETSPEPAKAGRRGILEQYMGGFY